MLSRAEFLGRREPGDFQWWTTLPTFEMPFQRGDITQLQGVTAIYTVAFYSTWLTYISYSGKFIAFVYVCLYEHGDVRKYTVTQSMKIQGNDKLDPSFSVLDIKSPTNSTMKKIWQVIIRLGELFDPQKWILEWLITVSRLMPNHKPDSPTTKTIIMEGLAKALPQNPLWNVRCIAVMGLKDYSSWRQIPDCFRSDNQ